jgi:hypothetical protein
MVTDKLFFSAVESQGKKAREAYMRARGAHNIKDTGEKDLRKETKEKPVEGSRDPQRQNTVGGY